MVATLETECRARAVAAHLHYIQAGADIPLDPVVRLADTTAIWAARAAELAEVA